MHVCPVLDEELHHIQLAMLRCILQRPIVKSVYVSAMLDEELHDVNVASLRCILQRLIVTRRLRP